MSSNLKVVLRVGAILYVVLSCSSVLAQPSGTPTQGLISYWAFDDSAGMTAHDSLSTNHGTIYGATWTSGVLNGALSFDGMNDYVEVPDSPSLDVTNAITISAWVHVTRFPVADPWWNMQVLQKDGLVNEHAYAMPILGEYGKYRGDQHYLYKPRRFGLEMTLDGNWSGDMIQGSMWSDTPLDVGQWYHLVTTYDGSQADLYLNGQLDASYSISGMIETNNNPVRIGNWLRNWDYFNGTIDEVAIYNRALTPSEVQNMYAGVVPVPSAVLLGAIGLASAGWRCRRRTT